MPVYEFGNMWDVYEQSGLFCITTNSTLRDNGDLVMGAGIAGQAAGRFEGLESQAGELVEHYSGHFGTYGLLTLGAPPIGLFQTKADYREPSTLSLIAEAARDLSHFAEHVDSRIDLNFPGIGLGGLDAEEVKPIVSMLPDNVHVWRYERP